MNPYLDGSYGIYTPRALSFLDKERTKKSSAFENINGGQISLTIINEIVGMVCPLRDLVCT
jgi:hypothetical protein